jgi:hypothetical protein
MPLGTGRFPSPKSEALKPMLWYLAVTLSPTAVASFSAREVVATVMLIFAGSGVVSFLAAYWWLLIKHPDRLQSEEYMRQALLGDDRSGRRAIAEPPEPPVWQRRAVRCTRPISSH